MQEPFKVLLYLILLFAAWQMWSITVRQLTQDKLGDIMSMWNRYWYDNNLDTSHPTYQSVRHYIKSADRFLLKYCFVNSIYLYNNLHRIDDVDIPTHGDKEVESMVRRVRELVVRGLQVYMVSTTPFIVIFVLKAILQSTPIVKDLPLRRSLRLGLIDPDVVEAGIVLSYEPPNINPDIM